MATSGAEGSVRMADASHTLVGLSTGTKSRDQRG
jgi:hypothetical protein